MSSQLMWQERYNIGVDFIDREHKKQICVVFNTPPAVNGIRSNADISSPLCIDTTADRTAS